MAEAKMFEWAGAGLGEESWYLISKAVKVRSYGENRGIETGDTDELRADPLLGKVPLQGP